MVDFKKAFDLVDHNLLLNKLKNYKISDTTLKWFSSYLIGRKEKVSINNILSNNEIVINGFPQGSILGPLLFLLFINDLPFYTEEVTTDLYVDDTTLYYTGKSIIEIKNKLQHSLISLHSWCKGNGMALNTSKTKVTFITTKQKRIHLDIDELSLKYENTKLNEISGDKILGVRKDNCLTFTGNIDNIAKKITSNIWLLSKLKRFLNKEPRAQFYKTYIQSHIDYCNIV